jgi:amino acid transporter
MATPGADAMLSALLGSLIALPTALVYGFLSSSMPRSGADYVWTSRFVNPILGFIVGWGFWISLPLFLGGSAAYFPLFNLPTFFGTLGYSSGNPDLINLASTFAQPNSILILGLILLVVSAGFAALGPRAYARMLIVMTAIMTLGTIVSFVLLAGSSHADFVRAVGGWGGTTITYDGIVEQAKSAGWSQVPIEWGMTITSIPMGFMLTMGFVNCTAAAGEVRNAKSRMYYSVVGSLLVALIINAIGLWLSVQVISDEFIQASTALYLAGSWPLSAPPLVPVFLSMMTDNVIAVSLLLLGYLLYPFWWSSSLFLIATRYVFAFAFDRAFPTMFADVNDKLHVPLKATLLNLVAAIILFLAAIYTTGLGAFLNGVAVSALVWGISSITAIVIPYKRKDLVMHLPGSRWKVPLISILGVISFVLMVYVTYLTATVPLYGPSTSEANTVLLSSLGIGLLVLASRYLYLKSRGIDLKMTFAEIPPE